MGILCGKPGKTRILVVERAEKTLKVEARVRWLP